MSVHDPYSTAWEKSKLKVYLCKVFSFPNPKGKQLVVKITFPKFTVEGAVPVIKAQATALQWLTNSWYKKECLMVIRAHDIRGEPSTMIQFRTATVRRP